jgi:DNA-binding NarL/FixJ family response regulator
MPSSSTRTTGRAIDLTSPDPHDQMSLAQGLAVLAEQVREQSASGPLRMVRDADGLASLFEAELRLGLEAADVDRAYEAAAALLRRTGDLARCHAAVSRVLHAVGVAWAAGTCSVAREHRITTTATAVLARLRSRTSSPSGGDAPVLLAVPPADRHVLALQSLAQLIEDAGHVVDVVGDLPAHELTQLARSASAVVLSLHVPAPDLDRLLSSLRAAAPHALLVVGGPAAPPTAKADLLSPDLPALLTALDTARSPLSQREREVLRCVADGLSNQETADALGVTPATIKTHLDHIFTKTGAAGRAGAVATGLRRGWIR